MTSIIHGRLRLPAHIRLSVVALIGMIGLVWLLFFGLTPRLHPTALRTGDLAPVAGAGHDTLAWHSGSGGASGEALARPALQHRAVTVEGERG